MITTREALQLIEKEAPKPCSSTMSILDATGCILSNDIISPFNSPPFDQAAMDGYAFAKESIDVNGIIPVNKDIPAGVENKDMVAEGTAVRIFTGAPVPENADTVVVQEWTEEKENGIRLLNDNIIKGSNIRFIGSQVKKGEIAVKAGVKLTPALVGYLCNIGITAATVFTSPRVGIIVTGNELIFPGEEPVYGKIFECNSSMLIAGLYELRMEPAFVTHAEDNEQSIQSAVKKALNMCDLILICGGISVGKFDFVKNALRSNNVKEIFYKVKQKPGKPMFFGKKDNTVVFGLPGNPFAVLTCFYQYVIPCVRKMSGFKAFFGNYLTLPLLNGTEKKDGLTYFLKGKIIGNKVELLGDQESYKLNAFTEANCLVELDEDKTEYFKGEMVKVYQYDC